MLSMCGTDQHPFRGRGRSVPTRPQNLAKSKALHTDVVRSMWEAGYQPVYLYSGKPNKWHPFLLS